MTGDTDLALIAGALNGEQHCFAELVKRHQSAIATTAMAMLGDRDDADEVGQLTFIRFYRSMGRFKGKSSLRTYLIRICINLCNDRLKDRRKRNERYRSLADTGPEHQPQQQEDERMEARQKVAWLLSTLDHKHRTVVVLRMIHGYSTKEASRILGLPQGTVLSRLKRAMDKMKEQHDE